MAKDIATQAGRDQLAFYDAIAPILDADSINWDVVWLQSRYDKGGADYGNVPLDESQYLDFVRQVNEGGSGQCEKFRVCKVFEGCLPIEVMAGRGPLTLAHGPLKPVGLTDPRTGEQPFAVVQLEREQRSHSLEPRRISNSFEIPGASPNLSTVTRLRRRRLFTVRKRSSKYVFACAQFAVRPITLARPKGPLFRRTNYWCRRLCRVNSVCITRQLVYSRSLDP